MSAYSRIDLNNRITIQTELESAMSLKEIAASLSRSPSSVSREIKNHITVIDTFAYGKRNRCIHRTDCQVRHLCAGHAGLCRNRMCRVCRSVNCNHVCKQYEEETCEKLTRPPYVCNGCQKRSSCHLVKHMYIAAKADDKSRQILVDSRTGMNMTDAELKELDAVLSPRLKLGQSVHHIMVTSPDLFTISERTVYKIIKAGLISARPIDLPRMVRMSPRKSKSVTHKVDPKCRINRTYEDFKNYMAEHPDISIVEGDTVEGVKGGKCILTLTWVSCDLQLGFLRDHNNSASVTKIFDDLYEALGREKFRKLFGDILLLDNGSEFSNPAAIEKYGIKVFYCDPSSPYQKGSCEVTHEVIRRILPKGTSFNNLTQEFFDLAYSHINSYTRKRLNDRCSYDVFNLLYGSVINLYEVFHVFKIDPDRVTLVPKLLHDYLEAHPSTKENSDEQE